MSEACSCWSGASISELRRRVLLGASIISKIKNQISKLLGGWGLFGIEKSIGGFRDRKIKFLIQ